MAFPIGPNAIAVETEGELRDAIENDNEITHIYLANNITLTSGISINPNKPTLTIDGEYPLDSGNKNTLTDMDSILPTDTIGLHAGSNIAITIKNMVINGHNYYGVPYIIMSSIAVNTRNVRTDYENVTYVGPQMTFNCSGFTRYVDCDITIRTNGVFSSAQQVGEVNHLEIGGNTIIRHEGTSTDEAVFWFREPDDVSSLTILSGANVNVVSDNSPFMRNHELLAVTEIPTNYVIESDASFTLTVNRGISGGTYDRLRSFTLEENSVFKYIQTAYAGTQASLYLSGVVSVGSNAQFSMQAENGTGALIYYTSGSGRSLTVDNPLSFVLYNPNNTALYAAGTVQFSFIGGQLNAWDTAVTPIEDAGGFDDVTPHRWFKKDFAIMLEVSGSFTSSSTISIANIEPEDGTLPLISDLHLHSQRVISIGNWDIIANPVFDDGNPVSGFTTPFANMRAEYDIGGAEHSVDTISDDIGRFSIDTSGEIPVEIPAGTEITLSSNIPFLIKSFETTVIAEGELFIESAPVIIEFDINPFSLSPILLPRKLPEVAVAIRDMREQGTGTQWNLLVSITGPLQTASGHILHDAVVFGENAGASLTELSSYPMMVHTGGPDEELTQVTWQEEEGILIRVTEPLHCGETYSAHVEWELQILNG